MWSRVILLLSASCLLLVEVSECSTETVKLGESKTLQCKLKKENANCAWTFPDGTLLDKLTVEELDLWGVTIQEGNCDLTIKKAELKHDGTWTCKHGETLELTVLIKPDGPFLEWENGTRIVDDKNEIGKQSSIKLRCTSINGNPEPESMTWTVNDKFVNSTDIMKVNTEKLYNASIHLVLDLGKTTYSLENAEKERKVICTVKHVTGEQKVQHSFGNKYVTEKVVLDYSSKVIKGSGKVTLNCKADGIPSPSKYKIVNIGKNTTLEERQIDVTEPGKYQCSALASNGEWMPSEIVEITKDGSNGASAVTSNVWFALFLTIITIMSMSEWKRIAL